MSIQPIPTVVPQPQRMVVVALALALALTGETLFAAQAPQPAPSPQLASEIQSQTNLPNRINGREDWDVDYPSQLAPQAVPPRYAATRVAVVDAASTPPVTQHSSGTRVTTP